MNNGTLEVESALTTQLCKANRVLKKPLSGAKGLNSSTIFQTTTGDFRYLDPMTGDVSYLHF